MGMGMGHTPNTHRLPVLFPSCHSHQWCIDQGAVVVACVIHAGGVGVVIHDGDGSIRGQSGGGHCHHR